MMKNLQKKYKDDFDSLITEWEILLQSIQYQCYPDNYKEAIAQFPKKDIEKLMKKLNCFRTNYQNWYSESLIIIKQLLPDRLNDFIKFYERPKNRKKIDVETYVIEDYMQGIQNWFVKITSWIGKFSEQLNILKSVERRFESTLFDIKNLLQADLFDNELEAAKELLKKWFLRWAWAISWVVLEEHFQNICNTRNIKTWKKNPWINDFNDLLKKEGIIEIDTFRFIQRLWDLRNKCDHKKTDEPTKEDITELINWVDKIIKTVF